MKTIRKSVSFNGFSTVVVAHEKPATTCTLWYNREEFKALRAAALKSKMHDDSSSRRKNIVQSVLALQEEHKDNQLNDATGLKRYAIALSKADQKEAQKRASQDSIEAFNLHSVHKESKRYLRAKDAEEYSKPTKAFTALRRSAKSMSALSA